MRTLEEIVALGPLIPVVVIDKLDDAIPLAKALFAGGLRVLEITLRTPEGLKAIALIKAELPELLVGAGTVLSALDAQRAVEAGAEFLVSPGFTPELHAQALGLSVPYLPAAASPSEIMQLRSLGYSFIKLFPAEVLGGCDYLKALAGPFPDVRFCPSGGVNPKNIQAYLSEPNVSCVGASWMVDKQAMAEQDWPRIEQKARAALQSAASV